MDWQLHLRGRLIDTMRMSLRQPIPVWSRLLVGCLAAAIALLALPSSFAKQDGKGAMQFAADMAQRGNWREASYRWQRILSEGSGDPKLYNNLAVAAEAVGDMDQAEQYYEKALELAGGDPTINENYRRYNRLQDQLRQTDPNAERGLGGFDLELDEGKGGKKVKGKTAPVTVSVPIPPRISLDGIDTLLVADFITEQTVLLDVDDEMARFLRGEFRQGTKLKVLDAVPPPAIPEQTLEDLIKNQEFWKHLGREYDADLIVSGVVTFSRQETSGYQDVDLVNPSTGQKVRQTQFVEQEEFGYILDLLFMDGVTGTLMFRDRLRRSVRFRGLMNDPIHAFYELSESLGNDIVSVVATRMQFEGRTIFKR